MDFFPKKYIIDDIYILDYRLGLNTSLQSDESNKVQLPSHKMKSTQNTKYDFRNLKLVSSIRLKQSYDSFSFSPKNK